MDEIKRVFIIFFDMLIDYTEKHPELNMKVYAGEKDYYNIFVYDKSNFGAHIHIFRECRDKRISDKLGCQTWQLSCSYDDEKTVYSKKSVKGHYAHYKIKGKSTIGKWIENNQTVELDILFKQWRELLDLCLEDLKKTKTKQLKEKIKKSKNKFEMLDVLTPN